MSLRAKDAPDLSSFNWEDALRLETQLTEDERMLRDAARQFAQDELQPRVIKAYAEETFGEAHDAKSGCGFSFGNGCSTGHSDVNLFGGKKQTNKVVKPATFESDQ